MKPTLVLAMACLLSTMLASCGSKQSGSPASPAAEVNQVDTSTKKDTEIVKSGDFSFEKSRAVEMNDDFSNLDEVREKLNVFKIKVNLPKPFEQDAKFSCYKMVNQDQVTTGIISAGSLSKTLEVGLDSKQVDTEISCRVVYLNQEVGVVEYNLPKSLLIEAPTKLSSNPLVKTDDTYHVDRIIMTRDGVLITDGQSFTMSVNQFYSDDGVIKTFVDSDALEPLHNGEGKAGGNITFFSQKSIGKLNVAMIGQNGADQIIELGKNMNIPAADSSFDALDTLTSEVCFGSSDHYIVKLNNNTKTNVSEKGFLPPSHEHCTLHTDRQGHSALAGKKGAKGSPGLDGNQGGDTGRMDFISDDGSNFDISFTVRAGKGGLGGLGGLGSDGGPGGHGTSQYPAGAQGAPGDRGDSGKMGIDGKVLSSCMIDKKSSIKKCNIME